MPATPPGPAPAAPPSVRAIAAALRVLGGKWKLLILWPLAAAPAHPGGERQGAHPAAAPAGEGRAGGPGGGAAGGGSSQPPAPHRILTDSIRQESLPGAYGPVRVGAGSPGALGCCAAGGR